MGRPFTPPRSKRLRTSTEPAVEETTTEHLLKAVDTLHEEVRNLLVLDLPKWEDPDSNWRTFQSRLNQCLEADTKVGEICTILGVEGQERYRVTQQLVALLDTLVDTLARGAQV